MHHAATISGLAPKNVVLKSAASLFIYVELLYRNFISEGLKVHKPSPTHRKRVKSTHTNIF